MFSIFASPEERQRIAAQVKAEKDRAAQRAAAASSRLAAQQQQGRGGDDGTGTALAAPLTSPFTASSPPPNNGVRAFAGALSSPSSKRQRTNLLDVGGGPDRTSGHVPWTRVREGHHDGDVSQSAAASSDMMQPGGGVSSAASGPTSLSQGSDYTLAYSLSQASTDTHSPPRAGLVAGGMPVPISFTTGTAAAPPAYQPYPHVLQPHQNPYAARYGSRRGRGGFGNVIRGPRRAMPHFVGGEEPMMDHAGPTFYGAGATPTAGGVVDLTQEGSHNNTVGDSDVQLLSHSYNAFAAAAPAAPVPAYDPFAYDPYAAAFRAASYPTAYQAPPPPPPEKPLSATQFASLSKEQQAVVLSIRKGENIFFSGCAGTGKSHLLKLLAQFLPKRSTFFTASTGLAAVNIGGSTLHSFAGVGLGDGSVDTLVAKARRSKQSNQRWQDCKVLVVDEVSMIDGAFFDKLEAVARGVRRRDEPFGGVQLVLSGDFLQLPPVKATKPTFRAECWERCIRRRIVLTQVFRQQGDQFFIDLLANLRVGQLTLKEEATLKKAHYTKLASMHGVVATKLNPLKIDTADENSKFLAQLDAVPVFFKSVDTGPSEAHLDLLRRNCPATEFVQLKKGAQVMLLKNLDAAGGLCNGSRGIIVDFVRVHGEDGAPEPTPPSENDRIGINPMPYTSEETFGGRVDPAAGNAGIRLLPRVQFDNGVVRVIESDKWEVTVQDRVQACRRQIPLTLAWALTIHKSQGMTLERAEISAHGMFENGQLYVAVSRVKSLPGLRLLNFTRNSLRTDQSVVAWYRVLERETQESTAELLKEVDTFFPALEQELEEARVKNLEDEMEAKREAEIARAGPFANLAQFQKPAAAASSATTAADESKAPAAATSTTTTRPTGASSPHKPAGFVRASHMMDRAASTGDSDAKRDPPPTPPSSRSNSGPTCGRTPPRPFRSPLRNPAAAAISTAVAEAVRTGNDVIVSRSPPIVINDSPVAPAPLALDAAAPTDAPVPPATPPRPASSLAAAAAAAAASSPSHSSPAGSSVGLCCCCKSEKADHAIFGCMHLCLCADCQEQFGPHDGGVTPVGVQNRCPICQGSISKIQKMFYA